jgi:hypothetical protein
MEVKTAVLNIKNNWILSASWYTETIHHKFWTNPKMHNLKSLEIQWDRSTDRNMNVSLKEKKISIRMLHFKTHHLPY